MTTVNGVEHSVNSSVMPRNSFRPNHNLQFGNLATWLVRSPFVTRNLLAHNDARL